MSPRSKCDSLDCEGYSPLLVAVREAREIFSVAPCMAPGVIVRLLLSKQEHPDIANALVRAACSDQTPLLTKQVK